jgi:hypothetical protein
VVVPISAISIMITAARTGEVPHHAATRPDLLGQLLAIVPLVALTAALTMTSTLGWHSPLVLGLLAVAAAVAGICFVAVEHRVGEPMLPPAFTSRAFSGATGVGLLFNFGLYGTLFCLTIFLERTLRHSTAVTGVTLLPLTAVITLGALFSGRFTNRFGSRAPMALGLSGGLLGTCLLAAWGDHSGAVALAVFGAMMGCVGLCMPAMTGVALGAAEPRRRYPQRRASGRRRARCCPAWQHRAATAHYGCLGRGLAAPAAAHDPGLHRLPDRHRLHLHRAQWRHKTTSVIIGRRITDVRSAFAAAGVRPHGLRAELAGIGLTAKHVERAAEADGAATFALLSAVADAICSRQPVLRPTVGIVSQGPSAVNMTGLR